MLAQSKLTLSFYILCTDWYHMLLMGIYLYATYEDKRVHTFIFQINNIHDIRKMFWTEKCVRPNNRQIWRHNGNPLRWGYVTIPG